MRTFSLRIPASLAFALVATQAFAHAQLEKATPPSAARSRSPSEIRLEFSEGVELKFTKVTLTGPGGARASRGGENGARQSGGADRADLANRFPPALTRCTGRRSRSTRTIPREPSNSP